jgi:uncharacterized protein (TIGR00369 family)
VSAPGTPAGRESAPRPQPLGAAEIQARLGHSAFIRFLDLTVLSADAEREEVVMRMPMRPELERGPGSGQFHGGPIAAFIDTVGDYVLAMLLGGGVPTVNFRVDFLRPAVSAALVGTGRLRRAGRMVGVVDVDVHDAEGRLVAVGRGCYTTTPDLHARPGASP